MLLYVVSALVAFGLMRWSTAQLSFWPSLLLNTVLILAFMALIVKKDFPLSNLPVIGKYFK